MTAATKHARIAEAVLAFFAGPDLEEVIIGDLRERIGDNAFRYWREVILSAPSLALMQLRNLSHARLFSEICLSAVVLILLCLWEYLVARRYSWPIAREFVGVLPFSADGLCKAAYVALFASGAGSLAIASAFSVKSGVAANHLKVVRILTVGAAASVIPIYLFWNPGPYDGPGVFRNFQFAFVWLFMTVAALPILLAPGRRRVCV